MTAKAILRLLTFVIGCALFASAQIDGIGLRQKYGVPLARETFTVMTGVEIVVDYAVSGHVCRIQLPPVGPSRDPRVSTPQAIDEFISELVPLTVRGKEVNRMVFMSGPNNVSMIKYENVTISEVLQEQRRTGVTVTFTKETCRDQLAR
jgi:hypothetical protein